MTRRIARQIKITHGKPPRTADAAGFLGRADLILAITLRLAHPAATGNEVAGGARHESGPIKKTY
jgi:hypothetical protein